MINEVQEELDVLEGELQTPNAKVKVFHSSKELAEFLLWSSTKNIKVDTGVDRHHNKVYQLQYVEG